MKILFTGGGTGGHIYPILAVIQAFRKLERESALLDVRLYYAGDAVQHKNFFFDNQVKVKRIRTGKRRQYFSILNFFDFFKTAFSCMSALWYMFLLYPDVVFGKGGAVSFPILLAARILRIPVIIHESDSTPGRTNLWAAKFARAIAVSYPEAAEHFPPEKTVLTGNPIRTEVMNPVEKGAYEFLKLRPDIPVIVVLGGSQGAQKINDAVLMALPELLKEYQVIHQVGEKNFDSVTELKDGLLHDDPNKERYRHFGSLNNLAMKMAAGAADLIISRAGSTIFEIAIWGKPSIIIPITKSNGNHQLNNAYYYARSGAASVIEENNLSPQMLIAETNRILGDEALRAEMSKNASSFATYDAAEKIAREIFYLAKHEEEPEEGEEE